MMVLLLVLPVVAALLLYLFGQLLAHLQRSRRLPPGPPGTLIAGNVRDVPKQLSWWTYQAWSKEYGPVLHMRIFTKHIIILNNAKVAADLLDKRASIYSDRPISNMNAQVPDRARLPFMVPADHPRFPVYRQIMRHTLGPSALKSIEEIQELYAQLFLKCVLEDPDSLDVHVRRNAAAVIMRIAYGYVVPHNATSDPFVDAAEDAMKLGVILRQPGRWLVDSISILRFIPEWCPGGGFKRQAKSICEKLMNYYRSPIAWVKSQMLTGSALPSLASRQLTSNDISVPEDDLEDVVMNAAAALYIGAADTTLSVIISFFYNMMVHPAIQACAQEELNRIVGHERLPNMSDRPNMPYVDRIITELLRWCPPGPLALPHQLRTDDEYDGYFIPGGSTVLANIWAIMHDETVYPNPYAFNPERFSPSNGHEPQEDPRQWVWGFGRRVCPGQYFAESALFINIASVLAVFNISKPVDATGCEVELPALEFTSGQTTRVRPFNCRITTRPEALGLVAHLEALRST